MGFLSYEAINSVTHDIVNNSNLNISGVLVGCKALAISFLLINWIKELIERKVDPDSSNQLPVSVKSILYGVFYIFMIVSWTGITQTFDNILGSYADSFEMKEDNNSSSIFAEFQKRYELDKMKEALDAEENSDSILGILSMMLTTMKDIGNGFFMWIILYPIKAIAWLVNIVTYPIFQIERAFLLFLMNIIGPLVLALAALDKFRDIIVKWFKVYAAIYITGILFIFANWFSEELFQGLYDKFVNNALSGTSDGYLDYYENRHLIEVCIFTVIAFAKVKLYGGAITLTNRIFG